MTVDINFVAPQLPTPPDGYDPQAFEQFNNVLRIYFNQLDNALRDAMAVQEPYDLQVSKGQVAGATPLYKFGFNSDIDGTEETIWEQGGNVPWPTAAFTAYIVSDEAADNGTSTTGAQTVTVQGLDADYNIKSVSVTLNGTTEVAISGTWIRINRAFVTLSGTGGTAAGTIHIQSSGGGVVYANLSNGNQTQMAVYTVPAGHTLYLDDINFTAAMSLANKSATVKLVAREFGSNTFRTRFINVMQSSQHIDRFEYPFVFPEKTDIESRAFTTSTNNEIGASFQGVLIAN